MPPKAAALKHKAISNGKNIIAVKDLKRDELARNLRDANIEFDNDALKPRLQATFALKELGLITPCGPIDELLLVAVTKWCCMSANDLAAELCDRKLDDEANKWKRVEALIRNEYENTGVAKGQGEVQDVGDALGQMSIMKKFGPSGANTSTKKTTQHPEPTLMNLVLTLLYGDVTNNHENARSGCPIKPAATVIELMNTMLPYTTAQGVASALSATNNSPKTQLISWLSSECTAFAPATGEMKIPGFQDSLHQFVIIRQNEKLHAAFEDLMKESSGLSRMVWHGTSLCNVHSILRNGFRRSFDGFVWSAEEAIVSYDFSFQYPAHPVWNPTWSASPYKGWGALLGCEVAGGGKYFAYGPHTARIMPNPSSIIVRYVLLLPQSENTHPNRQIAPKRTEVEPAMLATFKKLSSQQAAKK